MVICDTLPLCSLSHFIFCNSERRYAECHYAERHGAGKMVSWQNDVRHIELEPI